VPFPPCVALLALLLGQARLPAALPDEPAPPSFDAPAPAFEEPSPAPPAGSEPEPEGVDSPFQRVRSTMTTAVGLSDVVVRADDLQDEDLRRSHVPFLPSAAAPVRNRAGTHLAAGVMGQLRTRTLSAETGYSQWDTDLEVVPALALYAFGHQAHFTLGYAPRLYFPGVYHGGPMSVLQRGTTRLEWTPSSAWALAAWANGTYGDYSQLIPTFPSGGAGGATGSIQPIRSYLTYPYLSVDAAASAAFTASRWLRLRLQGGWSDVGGLGTQGQLSQPRAWGPRADASADVLVGARTILTSTVAAAGSQVLDGSRLRLIGAAETWSQRWSPSLETSASLGAGLVNNDAMAKLTFGHVIPALGAKATWIKASRDMVRVIAEVALGPYLDTYQQAAYQRFTGRLGVEWFEGRQWKLEGSLAAALVPFLDRPRESYAVTGASAAWSPRRWATLVAGGYAQTQLTGSASSRFVQLTGYLSVSFQSPDTP
jgi:hypothetical protein